jgi:hypothetical protein
VGAMVLTLLPEVFGFLRDWYLTLYGALFVVLMMVRPQGLIGRSHGPTPVQRAYQTVRRAVARGRGGGSRHPFTPAPLESHRIPTERGHG